MSKFQQIREPRSRTILRHTRQAIGEDRLKTLPFSEKVAERYLGMTAPEDRTVGLRDQGETMQSALAAKKHNGVVVDRLIKGAVRTFPADLEDAWVLELPQPYRQRCEVDLAARRGHIVVRDPRASDTPAEQTGDLACLLREFGDAATALAPIFANGVVDLEDLPHVPPALQQIGELLTSALQVHRRLTAVAIEAIDKPTDYVTPMRGRGRE